MTAKRYTPRGTTFDPCPGCGGEENRPRLGVCNACRQVLDHAKKERENTAAVAARKADTVVVQMQEKHYALPHLRYGDQDGSKLADKIKHGCWQLSMDLSTPCEDQSWTAGVELWPHGRGRNEWRINRVMPKKYAKLLREIYTALLGLLDNVYTDGHEDGRNLLNQLAAGTITADEFNDTSTRRER